MAVTRRPTAAAGVPALAPLRTPASPASQALVAGTFLVAFAGLAWRAGSALWFAAPATALLIGIGVGIQVDLRRFYARVPGLAAAMGVVALLTLAWAAALGWMAVELPYTGVLLIALVAFAGDWRWVERLRPATVASGGAVALLVAGERVALPLVLVWFALGAAALWSLREDALRAVPTPVPLDHAPAPRREVGAGRTAVAVVASWMVAAVVVALAGLVPLAFAAPETGERLGAGGIGELAPGGGSQSGSDPAGDDGGGGDIGPGEDDADLRDAIEDRDVDGDGVPDRDIDGDGVPDVDLDGDGIPDVDRDGDGIPDPTTVPGGDPGEATPGSSDADGTTGGGTAGDDARRGPTVLRVLGSVVLAVAALALVALAVRAVARDRARRRALAARPWAVRLAERLEHEGARRGRSRRRDEPVSLYASALAVDVLPHDRLAEVGAALSAAMFGARAPSDATAAWAIRVVDEAVEATPAPTWWDAVRARRPRADRSARRR